MRRKKASDALNLKVFSFISADFAFFRPERAAGIKLSFSFMPYEASSIWSCCVFRPVLCVIYDLSACIDESMQGTLSREDELIKSQRFMCIRSYRTLVQKRSPFICHYYCLSVRVIIPFISSRFLAFFWPTNIGNSIKYTCDVIYYSLNNLHWKSFIIHFYDADDRDRMST